jgi:hypothetical protein
MSFGIIGKIGGSSGGLMLIMMIIAYILNTGFAGLMNVIFYLAIVIIVIMVKESYAPSRR